jgi:hypothetical protein
MYQIDWVKECPVGKTSFVDVSGRLFPEKVSI